MTELMWRRRALMAAGVPVPSEWDSKWIFTSGVPTVAGWTRATTGGTHTMTSTGLRLIGNRYTWDSEITNGIIEARFQITNERSNMSENRAILRIGNASNAVTVCFKSYSGTHKIRLWNRTSADDGTSIGTFTLGDWYTVRLTINGSIGTVTINDVLVADNVNTAGMVSLGVPMFGGQTSYGGSVWEYVKIKTSQEADE